MASGWCVLVALAMLAVCEAGPSSRGGINYQGPDYNTIKGQNPENQLQPDDHDNLAHGMPAFLPYEVLYVENNYVLVWMPLTGHWRLHKLMRDCGMDCSIMHERPEREGTWPHLKMHKLLFMGCHPGTGYGHMLDVEPQSGNYTIQFFDHLADDPMVGEAAHHHRLQMVEFQLSYLGKDELLMYDGVSDQFQVYIVEPRLPMDLGEDPIGPFEALVQGNFSLHEMVIYLGHDHVLDYSPETGEYRVLTYDRGAAYWDPPFTHVIAEGHMEKHQQLTYLAEHQMMAYDPFSGKLKAFDVYTDPEKGQWVKTNDTYYGFGSLLLSDQCAHEVSCSKCIDKDGCGWCHTNDLCYRGNEAGPCVTNCTAWELHMCPGEPCHLYRLCSDCLADPFCGWCANTGTCTEGSFAGPLFGDCDWSKTSCPVLGPEEMGPPPCQAQVE